MVLSREMFRIQHKHSSISRLLPALQWMCISGCVFLSDIGNPVKHPQLKPWRTRNYLQRKRVLYITPAPRVFVNKLIPHTVNNYLCTQNNCILLLREWAASY